MTKGRGFGNMGFIGGTGAFANIQCPPNDDSFYCKFAKIYSEISMGFSLILMIALVIYVAYIGLQMLQLKKLKK